jgi:cytochrome b6-f complex iron-sulfur subunit
VLALYKVCVHLGCLYTWKPVTDRFECPCHGSKYLKDGVRVHRPASRDLDRFVVRALDEAGNVLAETGAGQPLGLPAGTAKLQVDTGVRFQGRANTGPDRVD